MDCGVKPGNDDIRESLSRRVSRPSFADHHDAKENSLHPRGSSAPKGACRSLPPCRQARAHRCLPGSGRQRALSGRARLPALCCGTREGFDLLAQLQARLPETRFGRALPGRSCPSPETAPLASVVMPRGMLPGAARERMANPPAGTALAPPLRPAFRKGALNERGNRIGNDDG